MEISKLDHLVLTVRDIGKSVVFYETVLGMKMQEFGDGRVALYFARQKINLHQLGSELAPFAERPTPGSADLCFIVKDPIEKAMKQVKHHGIEIILGPVNRTGAAKPIRSFYFRDPDNNLIELANEL